MTDETKHSPEPWRCLGDEAAPCGGDLVDAKGCVIAFNYEMAERDRRRAAACVNACAGIPTVMLEDFARLFLDGSATPWKVRDAWETIGLQRSGVSRGTR